MSPTFVLRHATPWFIYFRPTLNYTALWELSWNFTWWFKLLKVLVPICDTTFRCSSCFQGFYQYAGGSSPFMSLLPTKLLMNWEDITADHRDVPAVWTVVQAVTILGYASISLRLFDAFEKVYFDRYFESPSTSGPICYAILLYISPLPFDVTQRVIHFFEQFTELSFQFFITWTNQVFVLVIFRSDKVPCSHLLVEFYIFTWHFSTFHSLVFSTSSSCRWWTTCQPLGLPHRSSLLLFSFLFLKAVGFEQSVQSKDKIKSLQVCVCVLMLYCVMWREAVWCVYVLLCVCVCVCVCWCCIVWRKEGEARKRGGGGEEARRCQPKNKNPTRQCGEL